MEILSTVKMEMLYFEHLLFFEILKYIYSFIVYFNFENRFDPFACCADSLCTYTPGYTCLAINWKSNNVTLNI